MADYIERQAAIAVIDNILASGESSGYKEFNRVKKAIAALPGPWVSVADRPPERDGYYLCLSRFKLFDGSLDRNVRTYLRYYSTAAHSFEGQRLSLITHWMPKPDVPGVREDYVAEVGRVDGETV